MRRRHSSSPNAYTLAGSLIEEASNPDSILSCWSTARENGRQVRSHLPLAVWTCLNQGYLWMRDSDLPTAWASGPVRPRQRGERSSAGTSRG